MTPSTLLRLLLLGQPWASQGSAGSLQPPPARGLVLQLPAWGGGPSNPVWPRCKVTFQVDMDF